MEAKEAKDDGGGAAEQQEAKDAKVDEQQAQPREMTPKLELPPDLGLEFGCMNDYEVIKPIGKGKFSVVYRAKCKKNEQLVALKKVAIFDMMDDKARDKCLKEVRLLQSLDHPNIVRYLDAFIDSNELIIIFEWAEAGDLKRQVRKAQEREARFDERVIWKYFVQICEAIRHMHERRVLHRDLKPANIFLTLKGIVKVGDLGLGRHLSENTMEAHSKVGTPLYMSPEVLRGNGYGFKSDIWSLGCVLYEMAMLRSPFKSEGLNLYGLFQKISKGDFQPLPDVYSETLRNLAYRMISVDAADRPDINEVCRVALEERDRTAAAAAQAAQAQQQQAPASSAPAKEPAGAAAPARGAEQPREDKEHKGSAPAQRAPSEAKEDGAQGPTSTSGGARREREQTTTTSQPQQKQSKRVARGAASSAQSAGGTNVFAAAEDIHEKLKLLRYDGEGVDRLSPVYFAMDMSGCVNPRSRHEQFSDALEIAAWLLSSLGQPADELTSDELQPVQLSSALLVAARKAGVPDSATSNLTPTSLTAGFGASVCTVLNCLADEVVSKKGIRWAAPQYPDDDEDENIEGDDEADAGSEIEDEVEAVEEDGPLFEEEHYQGAGGYGGGMDRYEEGEDSGVDAIKPTIDPKEWELEMERAAPKLRVPGQLDAEKHSTSWISHLEQLTRHSGTFKRMGIGQAPGAAGANTTTSTCLDSLSAVAQQAQESASSISRQEIHVNQLVEETKGRFATVATELRARQAEVAGRSEEVSQKSEELQSLMEDVDATRAELDGRGETMSDSTPLVQIRRASQQLNTELGKLDTRIGVLKSFINVQSLASGRRAKKDANRRFGDGDAQDGSGGLDLDDGDGDSDDSDWLPPH